MSLNYEDQILWPVYIICEILDKKKWESQKWPKTLFPIPISIIYKRLKNSNNKNKDLKAKIYYIGLKIILQSTY